MLRHLGSFLTIVVEHQEDQNNIFMLLIHAYNFQFSSFTIQLMMHGKIESLNFIYNFCCKCSITSSFR